MYEKIAFFGLLFKTVFAQDGEFVAPTPAPAPTFPAEDQIYELSLP